MKLISILVLAFIMASNLSPQSSWAAAPKFFPYPIDETVLANGLKVVSIKFPSPKILSYYTIVRTGSRNEIELGKTGFAHFFEHLMFRGTKSVSAEQYEKTLQAVGADHNAFTTEDWTAYHVTANTTALPEIIRLEADRFLHSEYSLTGFQQEAGAVRGEYDKSASNPFSLIDEVIGATVFTKHTYRHTVIGYHEDVLAMPKAYEYSKQFFQRWYRPDNTIILVVGDVDHDSLVSLIKKSYGPWKPGTPVLTLEQDPPQQKEKRVSLTWNGATSPYLTITYRSPAFDPKSKTLAALAVLSEALFSSTGSLYQKLVLDEKIVESISGSAAWRRDPATFSVVAKLQDKKNFGRVEKALYQELDRLAKSGLPEARLAEIKQHLRYSLLTSLDTSDEVASYMGNLLQLTNDTGSFDALYETYETVSNDDLRAAIGEIFPQTNRTVITLVEGKKKVAPVIKPVPYPGNMTQKDNYAFTERSVRSKQTTAKSPLVSFRLAFRAGSQNDPKGKAGIGLLTAAAVAEGGSKKLTYPEFLKRLYPMGASFDFESDRELSVFSGTVHQDLAKSYFSTVLEPLVEPAFRATDIDRLKKELTSYLKNDLRSQNDEALSKAVLTMMIFPDSHPYHLPPEGAIGALKSITPKEVSAHYRDHFKSGNFTLLMEGGTSAAIKGDWEAQIKKALAQGSSETPELVARKPIEKIEVTVVEKEANATAICIGFPLDINRHDDDFYPLAVANSALGEHRMFQGRLMRNMRMKRGLNYGDYSYAEYFEEEHGTRFAKPNIPLRQQYYSIWIRPVAHENAAFAIKQAIRELDRFVAKGLSEEEFNGARNFIRNVSKLWIQTPSRALGFELDGLFYGKKTIVQELEERTPKMTLTQVNQVIQRHLQAKNLAVAIVTKPKSGILEKLANGEKTPIKYQLESVPEELLSEDKEIESYPLSINRVRSKVIVASELFN